jgi:starvation-inducible outer membrane lipoprotein
MRKAVMFCAVCLMTFSCAKPPDAIAPSYVSDITYRSLSCNDLAVENARFTQALATASKQQEQARTNDTVGIIMLGLPVSSMSGDNIAPEIARLKGEIEAIHRVGLAKKCNLPPPPAKTATG